jgi:hypothetical protein
MARYRARVSYTQYRYFDFEADNEDLAWDHADKLMEVLDVSTIINEWESFHPDALSAEDIELLSDKEGE